MTDSDYEVRCQIVPLPRRSYTSLRILGKIHRQSADGIHAKAEEKASDNMSYTNSIESFCNDGTIGICYSIDGEPANREGLMSVASSFERFLQHASNRKLVPMINMLLDTFGRGDHAFGSSVLLSAQATIDGNSLDMVIEFKINRRLKERQMRLIKAHITQYLLRDTFECFNDMIGELIFEGSLAVGDDDLVLANA